MILKNTGSDAVHSTSENSEIDFSLVPFSMHSHGYDLEILHAYLDAVPAMLIILGTDQIISFVNDSFCTSLNYTKQELIGLIWLAPL